jgi:hypothetical protein
VSLGNGDLRATGFTGQLRARLVNGSLQVSGSPTVSLIRAGGPIGMDVGGVSGGGASVTSLAGEVRMRLAPDLELHLLARAGSGEMSISGLAPRNVSTDRGGFSGDLNGGGPRLAVTSVTSGVGITSVEG